MSGTQPNPASARRFSSFALALALLSPASARAGGVAPTEGVSWVALPKSHCPGARECASGDLTSERQRSWNFNLPADGRQLFARLGSLERRWGWEREGGATDGSWPSTLEERQREQPRCRLTLLREGAATATYAPLAGQRCPDRSGLAPDRVEAALSFDHRLRLRAAELRAPGRTSADLRVIFDEDEVPTALLALAEDGALACLARARGRVLGPSDQLLVQPCGETDAPERLIFRDAEQPALYADAEDGYRARPAHEAGISWWSATLPGRLLAEERSLAEDAEALAAAPLPPLPEGVDAAPPKAELRPLLDAARAAWPVPLVAALWLLVTASLLRVRAAPSPAPPPPPTPMADAAALRARVQARARALIRALLAQIGLPQDALVLAIEARLTHRLLAEASRDPTLLERLERARGAEAVELPNAAGLEPATVSLAWLTLREVLCLPGHPQGMLGELAGRGPLATRMATRGVARLAAGEGRAWLAESRIEAAFWRAVLKDQLGRLEAARRDLGGIGSWLRPDPSRLTRAQLFLNEDLDDLYRGPEDAWERVRAALGGRDPEAAVASPEAISALVREVLRPAVPARFHRGLGGLFTVLGRVLRPDFWRGEEPDPAPGLPSTRLRGWYWASGLGAGLLFAGWLLLHTLYALAEALPTLGPGAALALLPLLFAVPLALHSTLALWAAGAAWASGRGGGWGRSRGDWLDRRATRRLLREQLPATDPLTGAPRAEAWAALVDHLAATHLLTRAEAAALRAPDPTSTSLPRPRDPLARERLRRWALRPPPAAPPAWDRLPSCTWLISAYGEKYSYSWDELVEPGSQDGADLRLRYLCQRHPLAWENLLASLRAPEGGPPGPAEQALIEALARLPDARPRDGALRAAPGAERVVAAVEDWANRRLPSNLRLVQSLEPLREALARYARVALPDPRRDALARRRDAAEALEPEERRALARAEAELRARVAEKLQVILRDDAVRSEAHAATPNAVRAREDLKRRGWEFLWLPEREVLHSSKYGGWGRALHRVQGEVVYGSDSHMELPFEDAPAVIGALGAFESRPHLGALVTAVESYSEGFSRVGRLVGGAETVWGAVEQRRKSWTDHPINAGKSFLRRALLLDGEALQDDYVSEDAATGFHLLARGLDLGFTDAVRLGWRSPVNLTAAAVPLGKYAAGSAEFLLGRAFSRVLYSERVHWTTRVGLLYTSLFYAVAALAAGLVPAALVVGYGLALAPRTPLPVPVLLGVVFVLLSLVLGLQALVLYLERRGGLLRATLATLWRVIDGFPFFNLLIPFYAQMFLRGLRGNAVFHVTQKTPDIAARDAQEVNELFRVPVLAGAALLPALVLAPWSAARAVWWAVLLLASLCWLFGPHLYYTLHDRRGIWTGDLVAALEGVTAWLPSARRSAQSRLRGGALALTRALAALAVLPAGLPIFALELLEAPRARARAAGRRLATLGRASPGVATALAAAALAAGGAATLGAEAAPALGPEAARDPAIRWIVAHTTPLGLVESNVGDPATEGWAYLYDQAIAFDALLAAGEQARALALLEATWERFPEIDGWRINAVNARFGTGAEWARTLGPNAHLARRCLVAWQLTGERRWLRRAEGLGEAMLAVQDWTEGRPSYGGVAMGPRGRRAGDQVSGAGVPLLHFFGLEANLAAHGAFVALERETGDPAWSRGASGVEAFTQGRYEPRAGAFLPGSSPEGSGEPFLATDVQGIAMSALGLSELEAISEDTPRRLLDWLDREAAIRSPTGELLGYDFRSGRKGALTIEWSAQIVAGMFVLARDLDTVARGAEAAPLRARGEELARHLQRIAWGPRRLAYAYLPDGEPARLLSTWADDAPLVPRGANLISAAYLGAVLRGWDPLAPLPAPPGPTFAPVLPLER